MPRKAKVVDEKEKKAKDPPPPLKKVASPPGESKKDGDVIADMMPGIIEAYRSAEGEEERMETNNMETEKGDDHPAALEGEKGTIDSSSVGEEQAEDPPEKKKDKDECEEVDDVEQSIYYLSSTLFSYEDRESDGGYFSDLTMGVLLDSRKVDFCPFYIFNGVTLMEVTKATEEIAGVEVTQEQLSSIPSYKNFKLQQSKLENGGLGLFWMPRNKDEVISEGACIMAYVGKSKNLF